MRREVVSVTKFILTCFTTLTEAFWDIHVDGSLEIHFLTMKHFYQESTKIFKDLPTTTMDYGSLFGGLFG